MAWELQRHMYSHIAPSIAAYLDGMELGRFGRALWLADRVIDLIDSTDLDALRAARTRTVLDIYQLGESHVLDMLVDAAIEYSATTNGGHKVYLSEWYSVPWCDDDTQLRWWA